MKKQIITLAFLFISSVALAQSNHRLSVAGNLKADTLVTKVIKKDSGTASQILLADGSTTSTNGLLSSGEQTIDGTKIFSNQVRLQSGLDFNHQNGFSIDQPNLNTLFIQNSGNGGTYTFSNSGVFYVSNNSYPWDATVRPRIISQGIVQAYEDVIANDTLLAGKGIKLAGAKPSQVLLANGTVTDTTATIGQVLTYRGPRAAPTWQTVSSGGGSSSSFASSYYTFSGTLGGSTTPALTERLNDLSLTLSTNQLSGFVIGGVYEVTISAKLRQPGNAAGTNQNAYFAISKNTSISSDLDHGDGAVVSINRTTSTPTGDWVSESSTEIWVPTQTKTTLYLTAYSDQVVGQTWKGIVTIKRLK